MALTIAGYLHTKVNKSVDYVPMNVRHLEIKNPVIARGRGARAAEILRITPLSDPSGLSKLVITAYLGMVV